MFSRIHSSFVLASILALAACTQPIAQPEPQKTLTVSASFYPAVFLAQRIGGTHVAVQQLTPAGVEPHDFEPSARDIASIESSALFLYNGAGMEMWADRVRENIAAKPIAVVRLADYASLLETGEEAHKDEHEDEHGHGTIDPHLWLDPSQLAKAIPAVRDALSAADPQHAQDYANNAAALTQDLQTLEKEMETGLQHCKQRSIVVSHNAFGYLAHRFDFETIAIAGLSPDQEPSPNQMSAIVRTIRERGISHVFFETLASPKIAQTIAEEASAQTLVLHPLEGITQEEALAKEDYLSLMRKNLQNLRIAMACQ